MARGWAEGRAQDDRYRSGLAAAALFVLPMQPGALADTGAKIVEEVDFATSCSPAVQPAFKHAVWTLHSFWYPEALKEFTAVTEAEHPAPVVVSR